MNTRAARETKTSVASRQWCLHGRNVVRTRGISVRTLAALQTGAEERRELCSYLSLVDLHLDAAAVPVQASASPVIGSGLLITPHPQTDALALKWTRHFPW